MRLVSAEQLQARFTPKQATPFFVDKLSQLSVYLQKALQTSMKSVERLIVARDRAYFTMAFFY